MCTHTHTLHKLAFCFSLLLVCIRSSRSYTQKTKQKTKQKDKEIVMITHSPPHWTPLQFDSCQRSKTVSNSQWLFGYFSLYTLQGFLYVVPITWTGTCQKKKKTRLKCCTIGDMKMAETIDQNTKSEVIFLRQASLIVVDGDVVYSVHTLMSHNPDNILFYEHGMWLLVSLLCHCNGPHSACTSSRFVILLRHPLVFTHGWWCL